MFDLIVVNATQILAGEQARIIRNVAATQLRKSQKHSTTHFAHDFCEGSITRKDEGVFGTFSGTFFQADLGTNKGERWTIDFLIPRNTEWLMADEDISIFFVKKLPDGDVGTKQIDTSKTESIRMWTQD